MDSPNQAAIDAIVRAYVAAATGISGTKVIPGNDNHPAPNGLYASVLEILTEQDGTDAEVTRLSTGDDTVFDASFSGRRFVTYSVQFYREGAADAARALLSYVKTTPGQIFLNGNDLTWRMSGDIRNLDTVMGSKYEQRRSIDLTFAYLTTIDYTLNAIASAQIELNLSAESDITEILEVTNA